MGYEDDFEADMEEWEEMTALHNHGLEEKIADEVRRVGGA